MLAGRYFYRNTYSGFVMKKYLEFACVLFPVRLTCSEVITYVRLMYWNFLNIGVSNVASKAYGMGKC